jgi:protein-tyrosine phosphatase
MTQKRPAVLFVCLGNICRSPSAEAVLRAKAAHSDVDIFIDSAGTLGHHTGAPPDSRSRAVGEARGYSFAGLKCRKVSQQDFIDFDYILAMDKDNLRNLLEMSPSEYHHKIALFLSYAKIDETEIPDPYYGGLRGFEFVLDLIEAAANGLLREITSHHPVV